ncbi:type II toxin-antitoxin system HicA family toxin [Candidatus Aerophobetes bacterium]|nr:type II toxin-antitoxin system HicA family toxin [Candidatus Aerophobetes bacterium]
MKIPRVTAREVERIVLRVGFKFSHSRGSHRSYHREDCRRVIIPFHSGKIIPPGTLKNILRQAELTPEDFSKLL